MSDKNRIIKIISKSFLDNPRIISTLKKGHTELRIKQMALYAYNFVKKRNGIFLTSDKSTILLYYRKNQEKKTFRDLVNYYTMFFRCIKLSKAWETYIRERHIKKQRPDIPDYIYVWILASIPGDQGLKPLAEVRDHLFGLSRETRLPLIIETAMPKVLNLYKYVGFEVYHEWYNQMQDFKIWFLKREPGKYIK
jgi:hypothetical protein